MSEKFALITGGSRGIGAEVCTRLARDGYHIIMNFHSNHEAANKVAEQIREEGKHVFLLPCDVRNMEAFSKALEQWQELYPEGLIDVLVNNAGQRIDKLFVWMDTEDWSSVIETHLGGFFNITKLIFPRMIKQRHGRIINIVSLSGQKGVAGQTNYSAAKAAVIGATKALSQEVGRSKITVNAISPGFIKTDMTDDLNEKELRKMIPLRRFGEASEVAAAVSFLASEEAGYITGAVIPINGGLYT
ncbi:MAG: 3-oxoacyl-ACP reductase FabG [Bacteroidetes bacterium]|nr:3-oxoacyl-ACP reductase FabG [Bacteroidota bacterium]